MAITFPSNNLNAVGSNVPDQAIDASEFSRVEPLITPGQLRRRQLLGIPLVSPFPDPLTKKPIIIQDEDLKDQIIRAVSKLELETSIDIFPVQHEVRRAFDRQEYLAFGYFQLPHRPVLSVQKLSITTPTSGDVYIVPLEWVSPGHLQRGQINLIPLQAAFLSSGQVPTQGASGAAFLSILGASGFVPEYWKIQYVSGFNEGKLPRVVNELIGIESAIEVLSTLQSLHKTTSTSIGIDSLSQSVGTPGPQVYAKRIEDLQAAKKIIVGKLKALFALNLFSSNV